MKPFETRPIVASKAKLYDPCMMCAARASVEVLFHLKDAILVRRYCLNCAAKAEY